MSSDIKTSSNLLARWILVAFVTGTASSVIVTSFLFLLRKINVTLNRASSRLEVLLPILGAVIVGTLILRKFPQAGGEGVPVYIVGTNIGKGRFNYVSAVFRYPVTLISLALKFSGGIVGPMVHTSAGIGSFLSNNILKKTNLIKEDDIRIASICAVSGAISAIFHSPLGGALFAAEVLRSDSMQYIDLMPALMAGVISAILSMHVFHADPFIIVHAPQVAPTPMSFVWLPLVAIFAGLVGMLFIFFFEKFTEFLKKAAPFQPLKAVAGGSVIAALIYFDADWLLGISEGVPDAIVNGSVEEIYSSSFAFGDVALFLLLLIAAKAIATSITIGSGMSAGFTGPLIIIGLASGALFSTLMGIPAQTPVFHSFLACGMSAIFGAVMNIPLAAIVITTKIFGTSYIIPSLIGGTVTFILFKSVNIYESRYHKLI